jgi:HlyD family secretion protein
LIALILFKKFIIDLILLLWIKLDYKVLQKKQELIMIISRKMKRVGVGIWFFLMVCLVLNNFSSKTVQMAEARRGPLQDYQELPGEIEMAQKETISSKYAGTVIEFYVAEGHMIKAGEELLRLRLADYHASLAKVDAVYQALQAKVAALQKKLTPSEVKRAELQLMQAQATAEQARRSYAAATEQLQRIKQLTDTGSATATQLQEAESRRQRTDAVMTETIRQTAIAERNLTLLQKALSPEELITAEAELRQLGQEIAQLRQTEGEVDIGANIDGMVLEKQVTAGATVKAGECLMEVGDYRTAFVRAVVPVEGRRAKIKVGQRVMISGAKLKGKIISGTVVAIRPELAVKYDNAKIILKKGDRLRLKIIIQDEREALCVPVTAVFNRFGKTYVYVVETGKAILRPVRTGLVNESLIEIKKGLFVGERVILSPGFDLRPGMKVTESQEL